MEILPQQPSSVHQERKPKHIFLRWLRPILIVVFLLAIIAGAILWVLNGQGMIASMIYIAFVAIGIVLSFLQLLSPGKTIIHVPHSVPPSPTSPEAPAPSQQLPVQQRLLDANPTSSSTDTPETTRLMDWGEAPLASQFYGRETECATLKQWIIEDHCQVVLLQGMGGIGKTTLAATVAEQIKEEFEYVFWRSLQNAPPLEHLLEKCILFLSHQQQIAFPDNINDQISMLLEYLRKHRCLLVLDNFETVLQDGSDDQNQYQEKYTGYRILLQRLGETKHQSCLLITSREKPREIAHLEGKMVCIFPLLGLPQSTVQELLKDRNLVGSDETNEELARLYSGNPLYLKVISEIINEVFGGDIASFLKGGKAVLGDLLDPLDLQVSRVSSLEREILYWLAIEREPISLDEIQADLVSLISDHLVLQALHSLLRRSLLEKSATSSFTLQPVVMEYMTEGFIEQIYQEIKTGTVKLLGSHALMKGQAKDYVRNSQLRIILQPLTERLLKTLGKDESERKLKEIISMLRIKHPFSSEYAAGNVLNLLIQLECDLRNADFSHLTVWEAYLQRVNLYNVNFSYADLSRSVFTEVFGNIFSIAFSPDGKLLAAGIASNEIRQWHTMSGTLFNAYQEHTGWIYSVAFNSDGKLLASGSEDQTVRLWEVSTGQNPATLRGHTDRIWSVAFSPNGKLLASGSHDHTIRIWDISTGECIKVLEGYTGRIWCIAYSPDGSLIASGSDDQVVQLWEVESGACIKTLRGHNQWVRSVAFSPDGNLIVSGSDDKTICLWNVHSGQCLKTLYGHTYQVRSVAFSPDGNLIVSGSEDKTVRLWEVHSGQCLKTLQEHASGARIASVAFSPDGSVVASGSEDQTVRLWEVNTGLCVRTLYGYAYQIETVAYSSDGKLLASGGNDQMVRLWNIDIGQCFKILQGHNGLIWSVAFNPSGSIMASGGDDQIVRLWNISSGRCIRTLRGHSNRVWAVAFSPDGTLLASGSEDQTIRLWDVHSGRCLAILDENTPWIGAVAFSPDGSFVASGHDDQLIRLWEVNTSRCIKTLHGHRGRVWAVAFSPDGTLLASGSEDQTVRLWDVHTGSCLVTLDGHASPVRSVVFLPDGKVGSCDWRVHLWEITTGQRLMTMQEHTSLVRSLALSPDGKVLASGSYDSTIKLWDIQTGECVRTLRSNRPYEGMNITGVRGLTEIQKAMLRNLEAIEEENETISVIISQPREQ